MTKALFLINISPIKGRMPNDSLKEVPVPALAPAVADSPRPIQVFAYKPTPEQAKPRLPDALVEMFLRELSEEPHRNDFYCDSCGRPYTIAAQEGKSCTRPPEGGYVCFGKITRRWTKEKAQVELRRLMAQGGVAIAWELTQPSVPVGLMVCEAHRARPALTAIDFPMVALESVYAKLGREEPFLVITHAWLGRVAQPQVDPLMRKLLNEVAESVMRAQGLADAIVLVPVSSRETESRRQTFARMFGVKDRMLARDHRHDRHRELWGFKIRAH